MVEEVVAAVEAVACAAAEGAADAVAQARAVVEAAPGAEVEGCVVAGGRAPEAAGGAAGAGRFLPWGQGREQAPLPAARFRPSPTPLRSRSLGIAS